MLVGKQKSSGVDEEFHLKTGIETREKERKREKKREREKNPVRGSENVLDSRTNVVAEGTFKRNSC